ncbi:MAG: DDE-type integrase/transposase/recombinase [Thermodesulfobacteriota bacterium]|nr:DDE-type integrase/transposase/recombinase [Thermodesulfobacteriota bacterium]
MKAGKHFTQEQKLIILESAKEVGVKGAADLAGIHYTTVYDWRKKLEALGEKNFLANVTKFRGRGIKKISKEQEKAILGSWELHPGYGPGQIRNQLRRQGVSISSRTVRKIMEANGYKGRQKKSGKKEWQRFEASRPLELVQMDILEFFVNKLKVYLLLLQDDHSRFIVGWRLASETSIDLVISVVQESINRYGKMEEILSDRGFVFYSWRGGNRFEKYLDSEGIEHTHARPHHPQTLGKIESTNKQIQKELLRRQRFESTSEAEKAIGKWVNVYNYDRTHQGLGGFLVPADRFQGRVEEVEQCIAGNLDPSGQNCYHVDGISRSLFNVTLEADGGLKLHLFGHPITTLRGAQPCRKN